MANVLQVDTSGDNFVWKSVGTQAEAYLTFDVYVPSATWAGGFIGELGLFTMNGNPYTTGVIEDGIVWENLPPVTWHLHSGNAVTTASSGLDTWHTVSVHWKQVASYPAVKIDATDYGPVSSTTWGDDIDGVLFGAWGGSSTGVFYMRNIKIGTSGYGSSELFSEDFAGGTLANFTSTQGSVSVIADPTGGGGGGGDGRVLIAFDDTPLEPSPTWTRIDDTAHLVAGIDIHRGKQTLLDRTDTGTATVYLNDTAGLFDPANTGSPYFGKLDGKQIMLQCWNPVTSLWIPQFRGHINEYGFDLHDSQVVSNIQIDCVDVFDYLAGYELAPGIDGTTPPVGSEGTVFYEDTAGTIDDRIIELLTDAGIDSSMTVVFTGNVKAQETKYDPGDAVLNALRDAADAELPGIANIYVDKLGRFVFHGRRSRFDPDSVAAGATPGAWDFTRWKVGDKAAIVLDSARAQIRVLSYTRSRAEVINAAISYPRGIAETDIPGQVYIDSTSIGAYGKHSWSAPDLIISYGSTTGNTANQETFLYGKFMVLNQKDPANRISQLTVKSVPPADTRASSTWAVLVGADISDIVNVKVGYPGGTGINAQDFYVEGVTMRIRPSGHAIEATGYDLVELDLDVSPAEWSMDTHNVFGDASAQGPTAATRAAGKAGTVSIT